MVGTNKTLNEEQWNFLSTGEWNAQARPFFNLRKAIKQFANPTHLRK